MALGSTQPLVKMSTRNISWGQRRPVREADNLTNFTCQIQWKSGSLNLLEPSGPNQACYRNSLPLPEYFPVGKVASAWSWPLTSNYCPGYEWPEAAFGGGKWGDRPRPHSFDKKNTVVHKQGTILRMMKNLNSCANSRKLI